MTFTPGSCKSLYMELAQGTTPHRTRLPPRQSERGAAAGSAGLDRRKGRGRIHLRRRGADGGVSPAAPYRHFRDRDELLSAIAQRGFEQFEAVLTAAWDDGRPDTVTAFERVGKAYLAFRARNRRSIPRCSNSGLPVDLNPTLLAASERLSASSGPLPNGLPRWRLRAHRDRRR